MPSDKILRQWTDPLGRKIALSQTCWVRYILVNHPDMAFLLEEVGNTVKEPEVIRIGKVSRLYYRKTATGGGNPYMMVAVKFLANEYGTDGFVATAFAVSAEKFRKDRGDIEWQKP